MNTLSLKETEPVFERIRREPRARVIRNILLMLAVFLGFWIADILGQFLGAVIEIIAFRLLCRGQGGMSPSVNMILTLFLTVPCILLCFVFCCAIERRSPRTMGLSRRHAVRDYLIGAAVGTGMMGAAVLISWAGGGAEFVGAETQIPWGTMLLFLIGWMIQGFSEELNFRGFFMMTAGTHHKPVTAVCVSSVLFAAAHLFNDGISVWAILNLTLFGVFAALYFLRTDSIWGVAAVHSLWNMAQGNFFGFKVSGIEIPETFVRFAQTDSRVWLNGGAFGPEGGAAVTAVLLTGIAVIWLLPQRKPETESAPDTAVQ